MGKEWTISANYRYPAVPRQHCVAIEHFDKTLPRPSPKVEI